MFCALIIQPDSNTERVIHNILYYFAWINDIFVNENEKKIIMKDSQFKCFQPFFRSEAFS